MLSDWWLLTVFIVILFSGWVIEAFWFENSHKKRRFNLRNYCLFLVGPLSAVIFSIYELGKPAVVMFLISIGIGAAAEYLTDRSYAAIFGANLWRYYRYNIKGSTSWLVLPIWGAAGTAFMLLGRALGI